MRWRRQPHPDNARIRALMVVAGGAAGALVALLFAPGSGHRTRSLLKDRIRVWIDQASRRISPG